MTTSECINTLIKFTHWSYFSKEDIEALKYAIAKLQEQGPKLAPCKKCGATPGRIVLYSWAKCRCTCPNCGYATKLKDSMDDAIFAWNQQPYSKSTQGKQEKKDAI